MLRLIASSIAVAATLSGAGMLLDAASAASTRQVPSAALDFIDTSIENASPLVVRGRRRRRPDQSALRPRALVAESRRRAHSFRAARARPGASLTLEFRNLDNVWNGQPGSVAGEFKTVAISDDGKAWRTVPTDSLPGNRVQLRVTMTGPTLHVARMEPYRLSDLERLLDAIRAHRLVRIEPIGQTAAGRQLEIIRIGDPAAPHRVFVRARAHPWEAGSNWVAQGLIERLLTDDEETQAVPARLQRQRAADGEQGRRCARRHPIQPAREGSESRLGQARGSGAVARERGARALARARDRGGPQAASGAGAAQRRQRPAAHQPSAGPAARSAPRAHDDARGSCCAGTRGSPKGTTSPTFRNSGTLGDGWLQRYGIDAVVHEFNCNWIEGLKQPYVKHALACVWGGAGAGVL